jgi:hypothetical protein
MYRPVLVVVWGGFVNVNLETPSSPGVKAIQGASAEKSWKYADSK